MKKLLLTRLEDNGDQTTGIAVLYDDFKTYDYFKTLELGWHNNEKNKSCIYPGSYLCSVRYSEKYGKHLIVNGVLDRSLILFHHGNFNKDTKGCILIGEKFAKINKDDLFDITNSKSSMNRLMSFIDDDIELTITAPIIRS